MDTDLKTRIENELRDTVDAVVRDTFRGGYLAAIDTLVSLHQRMPDTTLAEAILFLQSLKVGKS